MTYQPPHPPPSGPAVDDSTMPTRTPDTQIHPHGSAPGANAIYHPSPYTTHPLAPSHPQHHHTTVHAQLPITALSTHPPPAPNHPSYRSNGNSKNVHLRGASYSSVSSSGTNAHPSSHSRRPSQANNWTPSLQAIQAGTPHSHSHIDSSPLASMGGMGGMGGQGYQYSPTMHHQHAHGQLHPYPQPPPHLSQHQNAQGPIGRSFHPNVPSAPTPLKRSVSSSFAISHGHAQPGLYQYASPHSQPQTSAQVNGSPMMQTQQGQHTTGNVFGYNLTVIPPSNGNSTAASPIMQHAQVDMSGSQQGQMSTPQYVQMYTSPSHAMPHLESYPTYPHATYQLPNGTINAPAFAPSQPTTAPPIQFGQQPQAHIVEMDDESAEIEPEVEADADGGYEYEANVSRLQSHGGGTMVHPSRSRASSISDSSDSGGSSFSLEQSSRGARGGRGRGGARGGARGRGTKRKAKGSGWTKRKPARESAQNKGFKLGRPAGGRSGTATATTIAHSAEPGPSVQAFAQIPVYPTAPAPAPIPTYQAQYHTHSGLAETYDPTAFPEDGTAPPPEIAILLKNLQPGPLILPPPGCGLQIANLLIHVPAELSESKEIQLASKRWAHVIDASGAPMMLDPIRPHVHEQYTCRCCRKTYTGKNARSVARRHLQDKHGVPLVLQERRSRWDRSIRAKDTAEAHEREKKSKRESAKRARENQRLARAKVAAFAAGDTTVYTPGSSSAPSAFTRAPIPHPRPSLRSAPTGTNTAITATEGTPLVPVSPDYSLNSDGSPVLAGTASGRHNTPIEMVASIDSSSAQPMQNGVNGVGAHRQSEFDQRFEQTRSHLQKQGWSEQDIGAYYQQLAGGWIGLPPATAEAPLQGTVTGVGSVEMSRTGYGYPHGAVQPMPPSQAHGNVKPGPKSSRRKSHKRAASVSSSTSSWVHVENETPDYAQLKGQQTWVVPPPSVSADTPFTRAPLQSMQQNMSIGHGHLMGPAYTLTGGMGMGMGPSTVAASQDDAEVAAAGLVDLSSPIKGQPVKKKARPMPMRRANTVAVPSGDLMTGPAFGWSGQQLAPHDVGQVSQPLTIDTHAASGTAIDQAPLSAPASGSNPTFFPSTYAGNGPNIMLDHSANNHHSAESPLAYLSQSGQAGTAANGAGPSRIPRQPFARGRAQLARSISFSLPSTNSPIRLDDLDVFSQSMSRTNSLAGTEGPDDVQEGRENKRAKRSSAHGRTKASELLQPISERIQPLSEEESSGSTRAGDVKATGMGGVTATATGSPVTRGRKARAGTSGLVLGKQAGVRLALGSVSVDLGKAGQENSLPGPTMGLVQSPMKGGLLALAQSAPEQTYSLGSTTKLGSATASANGSPMFKLAANAFKTPLKQRDLNSKGNGTANLAPTLSDLNTPARLELEYTTPAPFSRLQSGNKAKNTSMHSHTRSLGFEPYSTGNSSSTRPGGSSMLTSLAPTPQPLGMLITPRRPGTSAGASAGGCTSTKYPQSVTRNWAGLSSPAHAGLAHQLGLTIGDGAADWQTPRVLRELNGQITRVGPLETPGMVDADADWDDEVL